MAIQTIAQLLVEANTIKNATIPGENTATRVGDNLVDIIDTFASITTSPAVANIPKPILSAIGGSSDLYVHFTDTGFDFTQNNPEIFLFRYRNNRNKAGISVGGTVKKLKARYVHPVTVNALTKWAGWKFFSGETKDRDGAVINTRITEWAIPSTILPYQKFILTGFNKYMFWNVLNGGTITAQDVNIFQGGLGNKFGLTSRVEQSNPAIVCNLSGNNRRLNDTDLFGKVVNYAFAVAVDNPNATQTNGLCPKIFGPLSDPIFSILEYDKTNGWSVDVELVVQNNNTWSRAARPSTP